MMGLMEASAEIARKYLEVPDGADSEVHHLVSTLRLMIGFCRDTERPLTQGDVYELYAALCELSDMLGIEPMKALEK